MLRLRNTILELDLLSTYPPKKPRTKRQQDPWEKKTSYVQGNRDHKLC